MSDSALCSHLHLRAFGAALALSALLLGTGVLYAHRVEQRALNQLAGCDFEQKRQGSALQRAAVRRPDMMLLYGSSEIVLPSPYHASAVFRDSPSGFTVFPVGKAGTTCLIMLQDLAALGGDLRGRKVAISLSPIWFFQTNGFPRKTDRRGLDPSIYAGNFSALHAGALAFTAKLSRRLRRDSAERLLQFPETLKGQPLTWLALQCLARDTRLSRVLYFGILPFGKLQQVVFNVQDHWQTVAMLWRGEAKADLSEGAAKEGETWKTRAAVAEKEYTPKTQSNTYGIADHLWNARLAARLEQESGSRTDLEFEAALEQATEWHDLKLLLRALRELGARPLLLSMPIKGAYFDKLGVSRTGRNAYYRKLEQEAARFGTPLIDFSEFDSDPYFLQDLTHLSDKGWVFFDEAVERFFHKP